MKLKFVDIGTHMDNTRNFIESFKSIYHKYETVHYY